MKMLAIDSSAKSASVAILEDGKILGETFINVNLTHSQTLMSMTESLLTNSKTDIDEIDAFAVSAGPGSFTGIRIGISCIKGLAFAKNKPCVAVSTLWAMAYNLIGSNARICAVMDARCGQVYSANFEISNEKIVRITDDRAISIDELYGEIAHSDKNIIFVGDGADLCYNKNEGNENVKIAAECKRYQRASGVALAGYEMYKKGLAISCFDLLPFYLRIPQAERELKKKIDIKKEQTI